MPRFLPYSMIDANPVYWPSSTVIGLKNSLLGEPARATRPSYRTVLSAPSLFEPVSHEAAAAKRDYSRVVAQLTNQFGPSVMVPNSRQVPRFKPAS